MRGGVAMEKTQLLLEVVYIAIFAGFCYAVYTALPFI
jgi:hypothetical protein